MNLKNINELENKDNEYKKNPTNTVVNSFIILLYQIFQSECMTYFG